MEPRPLQRARSRAVYTGGSLLYVDDGVLTARPFDPVALSFRGDAVALVEGVTQSVDALWGGALFSVSDQGTLLFVRGVPERRPIKRMQWLDREGNLLDTVGDVDTYNTLQISQDGSRVVTSIGDPGDLWIHDLERDTVTRFTFDPGNDGSPIWSPDDDRILFESSRLISSGSFVPNNLFQKAASGQGEEERVSVVEQIASLQPSDWSPDGKVAALTALSGSTGADILLYEFETGEFRFLLKTEYDELAPVFSPDGRWLAYSSDESGDYEVYVTAYPGPGGKWQVSRGGGELPVWSADGRELLYVGSNRLMAVSVRSEGGFQHDTPVALFELPPALLRASWSERVYDVAPDGRRFLFLVPQEEAAEEEGAVTLLQGWRGLLE